MAKSTTTVVMKPTGVAVLGVMLCVGVFITVAVPRFLAASTRPAPIDPAQTDAGPTPPTVDTVVPSPVTEGAPARAGALLFHFGESLLDNGDPTQLTVVPGAPARITVLQANPAEFWKAQSSIEIARALKKGDKLHLHLRARSSASNPVYLVVEKKGPPFSKDLSHRVALTPEWKTFDLRFAATQNHTAGDATFRLQVGEKQGELEVADLRLQKL